MVRKKHVPQRTCIVCRSVKAKRELVRIVRAPDQSLQVDVSGKAPGRGAYVCKDAACWRREEFSRKAVNRALKVAISDEEWAMLQDALASLP